MSWANAIKSDKMASLFVPAKVRPRARAEAYPMTEVLLLSTSFNLSPMASLPEANAVRPRPRQAPCMTT